MSVIQEARAVELYFIPSLSYRSSYDDNLRLQTTGDSAFFEYRSIDSECAVVDPLHRLSLFTQLSSLDYDAAGKFDTDDQFGNINYQFNGQRFSTGLDIGYRRDGAIADEFDISGVALSHNVRRETLDLMFSSQYQLSSVKLISASISYSDRRYVDGEDSGLLSSEYLSAQLGLYRAVSNKMQANISTGYSEFKSPDSGQTTTSIQLSAGADWSAYETLDINAYGGVRRTTSRQDFTRFPGFTEENASTAPFLGARFDKHFLRGKFSLKFDNSLVPGSEGELLQRRSLSFLYDHQQSDRLSWGVGTSWNDSEDAVVDDTLLREYGSVNTYYNYKLSQQLSVGFNLRYRWQENDSDNDLRESYASWIQFTWSGVRRRL